MVASLGLLSVSRFSVFRMFGSAATMEFARLVLAPGFFLPFVSVGVPSWPRGNPSVVQVLSPRLGSLFLGVSASVSYVVFGSVVSLPRVATKAPTRMARWRVPWVLFVSGVSLHMTGAGV